MRSRCPMEIAAGWMWMPRMQAENQGVGVGPPWQSLIAEPSIYVMDTLTGASRAFDPLSVDPGSLCA